MVNIPLYTSKPATEAEIDVILAEHRQRMARWKRETDKSDWPIILGGIATGLVIFILGALLLGGF
jgi:hypothetical protein